MARQAMAAQLAWWSIRSGLVRSFLVVTSFAFGTALLVIAVAIPGAGKARYDREIGMTPIWLDREAPRPSSYLLWHRLPGEFLGRDSTLVALAAVGSDPPVPTGLRRVPAPGEIAASPALADLLASPDGELLRPRMPGRVTATIGPKGLPSPDALVGYVGVRRSSLIVPEVVRGFGGGVADSHRPINLGIVAVVTVLVLGVIGPIGSLIVAATRLSSRTREARLAAMRLTGASAELLRSVAALESAALALAGAVIGVPGYLWGRSLVAGLLPDPFRWFPADLSVGAVGIVAVVLAAPCVAMVVSLASMRRVRLTPFGVVRRSTPPRGRPVWLGILGTGLMLIVLVLPLAMLRPGLANVALPVGLVVTVVGMLFALPWLTGRVGGWLAQRVGRPGLVIGMHAIASDPGLLGRAAGVVAVVILLGGAGQAFILASAPSLVNLVLQRTAAEPHVVFVSIWDPRGAVVPMLRSVDGVVGIEQRPAMINGSVGGRDLRNYEVRTDGSAATAERIQNALALRGSDLQVDWSAEARRRWLGDWLEVRGAAEGAVAAALLVVWVGLMVSSVDRTLEQRRTMAALTATGVPKGVLRIAAMAQVLIPLVLSAILGWLLFVPVTTTVFAAVGDRLLLPVRFTALLAVTIVVLSLATAAATIPWVRGMVTPAALRTE